MSEWISVDDKRDPPILKDVLISMSGDLDVAYFYNGQWLCYGEESEFPAIGEVTHWQLLPDTPRV